MSTKQFISHKPRGSTFAYTVPGRFQHNQQKQRRSVRKVFCFSTAEINEESDETLTMGGLMTCSTHAWVGFRLFIYLCDTRIYFTVLELGSQTVLSFKLISAKELPLCSPGETGGDLQNSAQVGCSAASWVSPTLQTNAWLEVVASSRVPSRLSGAGSSARLVGGQGAFVWPIKEQRCVDKRSRAREQLVYL